MRNHREERPYGSWESPLTAARVTAGALRLDQIQLDGDDVYWVEGRASEGGRYVIVKMSPDGATSDVSLGQLVGHKKLRKLEVFETKCTQAGVMKLRKLLPECEIRF